MQGVCGSTPSRRLLVALFSDGHYVLIRGQHNSAASLAVYQSLGGPHNDVCIPPEYQYVDAEVLHSNTPKEVCRLAAGEHQVSHRDVQLMSVAEIFSLMCQTAREKNIKHRTPYFTDNEVHQVCLQCGLQKFRDRSPSRFSLSLPTKKPSTMSRWSMQAVQQTEKLSDRLRSKNLEF